MRRAGVKTMPLRDAAIEPIDRQALPRLVSSGFHKAIETDLGFF